MEFRCTKAEMGDSPALVRLIRAGYALDGIAFDELRQRRALVALLSDASLGGAWLVWASQELAGYFVMTFGFDLEFGGRVATVTELYILEIFRRDGLGLRALGFAEKIAREGGAFAIELQAERKNEAALAFYERAGFKRHDRIPMSKRVLSLDDLRLARIEKDGSIEGLTRAPLGREPLADVITLTVSLYERDGFTPPWIGYVALDGEMPLGTCAFKSAPVTSAESPNGDVEIAYFTFPAFEGRGIATWMASRLMDIARASETPPELYAQTSPKEGASTAILRSLGFVNRGALLHEEDGLVWEWRERKF
jgi:GNAT superfamily N-acetyltransferase